MEDILEILMNDARITPEEIATAAVYWLGDESRPITGSVVELEQFSVYGRNPAKV